MSNYKYSYLNDSLANPLYMTISDLIKSENVSTVIDFACGYSRINEFLFHPYVIDGFDNDTECVEYCNKAYDGTYVLNDAMTFDSGNPTQYDCVVISGFMYYIKDNPLEFFDRIVKHYNPKIIIMSEPRPSMVYESPDFIELFDSYAWEAIQLNLNIRMGNRVVYKFFTDKKRPERKIKAQFNNDSIHSHMLQNDFDIKRLRHGVYVTNTEEINSERDGLVFPPSDFSSYISVSAGFKGMYKACIDFIQYNNETFDFVYCDVVPTSLNYRMYQDHMISSGVYDFDLIFKMYVSEIDNNIDPHYGKNNTTINQTVMDDIKELGISVDEWNMFLKVYAKVNKKYLKLDMVNNIKLFNHLITNNKRNWLWYSNIHDWHQFRFNEKTFDRWIGYLSKRNNITFAGKTPPFTSS
jgi:hypothetical protein